MDIAKIKSDLHHIMYGRSRKSVLFNRFLLGFNLFAVFLFMLEPLFHEGYKVRAVELLFGVIFLAEYVVRLWLAERRIGFIFGLVNLLDLIVVVSLFAPILFGNFSFLRVIRSLRILRTYRLLVALKDERSWFVQHEEVLMSTLNLFVFVFIMTDIVYVMQADTNDHINDYVDALYFTLTTLTTTGFGDITLQGPGGRLLSVCIMVFGITLFVKLARDIIRPQKVLYKCPDCGLNHHDFDAVHCKHCGHLISIETEGM